MDLQQKFLKPFGNLQFVFDNTLLLEHPPGVMGSIPVGDSEFFFVSRLCHVDQLTFSHTRLFIKLYFKQARCII